jgi:hypothetical protein
MQSKGEELPYALLLEHERKLDAMRELYTKPSLQI